MGLIVVSIQSIEPTQQPVLIRMKMLIAVALYYNGGHCIRDDSYIADANQQAERTL